MICAAELSSDEVKRFNELSNENNCFFTQLNQSGGVIQSRSIGLLYNPPPLIVFIGGLINEVNSFEIFLSLKGELSKENNVLALSTASNSEFGGAHNLATIINNNMYSEVEKVFAINDWVKLLCENNTPDVLIIHVQEPMIEYDERVTNGLGVIPYIISKAIKPDFFICGLPYRYGNCEYMQLISDEFNGRFGYGMDYVHLSNVELDPFYMSGSNEISVVFNDFTIVNEKIKACCFESEIPVDNLLTSIGLKNLISLLRNEMRDSAQVNML